MKKVTCNKKQVTRSRWTLGFCGVLMSVILVTCPLLLVALPTAVVQAEDVSFDASVDANRVPLGTAAQLTLTLHGSQDLEKVDLPAIDGFEARYVGPSTQVKVVNGEYSTAKAFTYMLLPLKEGAFTIPPVEITIKGQTYRTQPIIMQVVPASTAGGQQPGQTASNDQNPLTPETLGEKVHLVAALPRTQCYVNEQSPVVFKLYVADLPLQDITMPDIKQDGFVLSNYDQPKQYQQVVNGRSFQVVEFNARLTPTRVGTLTVGPALIGANILFRMNVKRNPLGASVFDDDFFSGFFGGYQKKPITVSSGAVQLTVQDVPVDGKPADFSGAVGQFNFEAGVNPAQVKVGDPVTLRMSVSGLGDFKVLKMPEFHDARFKTYDPNVRNEDGKKVMEQVIIPTKEDIKDVPAVSFSFFDTASGQYRTITQGPFALQVSATAKGEEFQAVAFAGKPLAAEESFGKDIVFIKDNPGELVKKGNVLRNEIPFYVVLALYLNLWGAGLAYWSYRRKMSSDPHFAHRMSAYREATLALRSAKVRMEAGDTKGFYDALVGTLAAYLVKKLDLPPGEAEGRGMTAVLSRHGVDDKKVSFLDDILETSDKVRFASLGVPADVMKRHYLDAEEILEAAEKRIR